MAISKSIVEKIASMDPPGRFLKKCPDSGEWIELSLKDAATRTSQAMAYAVRERTKQRKERRSLRLQRDKGAASSSKPAEDHLPSYVKVHNNASTVSASTARAATGRGGEVGTNSDSASNEEDDDDNESGGNNEVPIADNSSRQQQLLQLQPSTATTLPANSGAPLNGLVELIAQAQLQQRQQQQQQQQQQQFLRQLLGQFPMGLQTQLPSTGITNTLSSILAPPLSAQGTLLPNNNSDILRQASALHQAQGSTLMGSLQQSSLLQQNQVQSQPSPINKQALLGLIGMLQNQPPSLLAPAPTPTHLTSQLPLLSQQLNQVHQNQQNRQVQRDVLQNQLLASLLAPQNPLPQQQSQPLNLFQQALQQQIAQNNSASNPNTLTEARNAASARAEQGGDGKQKHKG